MPRARDARTLNQMSDEGPQWTPGDIEMMMLALMRTDARLQEIVRVLGEDDGEEWEDDA